MPDYVLLGSLGRIALDFNNRKSPNDSTVGQSQGPPAASYTSFYPDIKSVNLICMSFCFI